MQFSFLQYRIPANLTSKLYILKMGALIAKKLINWQALQERLDLQAVYRLTCMYEGRQPQQCSYEKQYLEVHCSITKQVIDK